MYFNVAKRIRCIGVSSVPVAHSAWGVSPGVISSIKCSGGTDFQDGAGPPGLQRAGTEALLEAAA